MYFHIEVTESAYSDNPQLISQTIRKFHDNGFVVELDDFGVGYSSMSALSELDLDVMKLDMSLIRKDNPVSGRSILEFSMQLARLLQLKTVAEGVETEEQKNRIASLGGDYIQGYYYSKPLPKEQFEKHLLQESA
jgi:EAL domain-containing protein (putative c-di-GMP-specific phosphodiesterase class I)